MTPQIIISGLIIVGILAAIIFGFIFLRPKRLKCAECASSDVTVLNREPRSTDIQHIHSAGVGFFTKTRDYGYPGQKRTFGSHNSPVGMNAHTSVKMIFDVKYRCNSCGAQGEEAILEAR